MRVSHPETWLEKGRHPNVYDKGDGPYDKDGVKWTGHGHTGISRTDLQVPSGKDPRGVDFSRRTSKR